MAEHDPEAFRELFESEPDQPTPAVVAEWVGLYTRLVDLLERQLEETQHFSEKVPQPLRRYLDTENCKILTEELEIFRHRLARWRSHSEGGAEARL